MKKDIRAIITDLDGTILPHGGSISAECISSFQGLGERNLVRIIATGRSLYAARKVLPPDFPIDYIVFSSGAGVMRWKDKEVVAARQLSEEEAQEIAEYLWDYGVNFMVQREIPENHLFFYTDIYPVHPDYKKRLEIYAGFGTPISHSGGISGKATQVIVILDEHQLLLADRIRRDLPAYSTVRSTSPTDGKAIWLEIFPQGINKGSVCNRLLEQLEIRSTECAGLGNDYNDVDFLDICGEAYLVENAPARLKPHYKSVAKDMDNGFVEFIRQVIE